MSIQCMTHEKCEWPDCSCSDATKKGRWKSSDVVTAVDTAEAIALSKLKTHDPHGTMHSQGDYERADPQKMQAVLNEHFGPVLAAQPSQEAGKKVIPIQSIDVAAEEAPKFDADVLAIMLHEAGATVDPDGCFYIERPAIRKLAEALNNL